MEVKNYIVSDNLNQKINVDIVLLSLIPIIDIFSSKRKKNFVK